MIVTVTPNGSVDTVLRRVGGPGEEEQEVLPLARTAGGKGHNVARFLAAAGQEVVACGFMGGWAGREMAALLDEAGVRARLTPIDEPTRRYVTCLGGARPRRSLHMPGPTVSEQECRQLVADVRAAALGAETVVLSGSLPPRARADLTATIIRAVAPTPVILDTSGGALVQGVAAGPRMVKVNAVEAGVLLGSLSDRPGAPPSSRAERPGGWSQALERLAEQSGIGTWWVTLGEQGAAGLVDGRLVTVPSPVVTAVNTTGAGDAFLAGLLIAEVQGASAQEAARLATAMAAAVCESEAPLPPDPRRVTALRASLSIP